MIISCPSCNNESISVEDWWNKYDLTDIGLLYFKCKSCKVKLGSNLTMMGPVEIRIWEKSKEEK